ncbi:MAG: dephospho-CoA kinase, partial [Bacteroidota bacterium]
MENEKSETLVVGITGGIGCGKSTVSKLLTEWGYIVISTDDKAKELMATSQLIKEKLLKEFGAEIYFQNGELNKAKLAEIVFGESEAHAIALQKLNSIVHPEVIEYMMQSVAKYEEQGVPLVFVESALIFEAELEDGFDYIIVVNCNETVAIERTIQRTGFSELQVKQRMFNQIPGEQKANLSDFAIENNGTIENLEKSVRFILDI